MLDPMRTNKDVRAVNSYFNVSMFVDFFVLTG